MLLSQNFRRRHERDLVAVLDHDRRSLQSHDRLSAADIPLQQPVHRLAALEVARDFRQHALLRTRGLEGKNPFERLSNSGLPDTERDAGLFLRLLPAQRQTQLVEKKLLENESLMGRRTKRV